MSSHVWIVNQKGDDEEIASCVFGDDAELIFNNYKKQGYKTWVKYISIFGESVTHSHETEIAP